MEFRDFLLSIGLLPRAIEPGKWSRCATVTKPKKRNGSFKLADDGRVGWAMDYAVHSDWCVWRPESVIEAKIDHAEIARRRESERVARERASEAARAHYAASKPLNGPHPYLERKGLSVRGCGGLRVDAQGWLVIPMWVGREISSIQRISPEGDKKFWPGAPVGGAVYLIGARSGLDVLCEGFATGLTLFQSIPNCRVVVAFNAGNLLDACRYVDRLGLAVVAADNDHATQAKVGFNPGVEKAQEAADRLGVGVAFPSCSGSDWDDFRQERYEALAEREALRLRASVRGKDIQSVIANEIAMAVKRQARRVRAL